MLDTTAGIQREPENGRKQVENALEICGKPGEKLRSRARIGNQETHGKRTGTCGNPQ